MTWKPKPRKGAVPWRRYLLADEKKAVAALEKEAAQIDKRRREITAARIAIVNRATQRARYHRQEWQSGS